jgi:hypothetical protein
MWDPGPGCGARAYADMSADMSYVQAYRRNRLHRLDRCRDNEFAVAVEER